MELVGAFLDEEWESLSKMFSGGEIPDSFLQCGPFPAAEEAPLPAFSEDSYSYLLSHQHAFETNVCSVSQESSNTSEILLCDEANDQQFGHASFGFCNNLMMPVFSDDAMEEILNSTHDNSCKRKKSENHSPQISPNKIPRLSRNVGRNGNKEKKKKKMEEKKNEEESKSSCSSEDDSIELINGGSTNIESKGKKRASATDPQSLYARKRRERINERLKILQNLVPNGTKVDISTMLEEAVQYVKFLQLQIKLLSSDDLWMYAPIAYNGMDIGMYQNISPNLRLQIN